MQVRESGTVVLSWDNGYSMLRSKTVAYRAWVDRAGAPLKSQGSMSAGKDEDQKDGAEALADKEQLAAAEEQLAADKAKAKVASRSPHILCHLYWPQS